MRLTKSVILDLSTALAAAAASLMKRASHIMDEWHEEPLLLRNAPSPPAGGWAAHLERKLGIEELHLHALLAPDLCHLQHPTLLLHLLPHAQAMADPEKNLGGAERKNLT